MQIKLLEYTTNPEKVIAKAAKQCYDAGFIGDDYEESPWGNTLGDSKRIQKCINSGHLSVLEHASFTFAIEGISRVCSHQLVRFRIASFSQQSQRYCTFGEFDYVVPETIKNHILAQRFHELMIEIGYVYQEMINEKIPAEDARFILPNACCTNLVMTMNARELLHAFELRLCTHAQWEIREMFQKILNIVEPIAPVVFAKAGPSCVSKGYCTEGERSCGKINSLTKLK